ncbi:MAG: DUF5104 domain-containing protein [Oscillospiraceae bacterium]|nr:DUF5104 domain-containing protein [Oscillospiraceae bacterium]
MKKVPVWFLVIGLSAFIFASCQPSSSEIGNRWATAFVDMINSKNKNEMLLLFSRSRTDGYDISHKLDLLLESFDGTVIEYDSIIGESEEWNGGRCVSSNITVHIYDLITSTGKKYHIVINGYGESRTEYDKGIAVIDVYEKASSSPPSEDILICSIGKWDV